MYEEPASDEAVTCDSFRFHLDKGALNEAERRDGYYLLRSNLTGEDPAVLWSRYVQLTQIESVFRSLKSELGIRADLSPEGRPRRCTHSHCVSGILPASHFEKSFDAYAPGLTPSAVLEKLGTIQMIDVCIPTCDGRWLILPRYTQPDRDLQLLLHHLQLELPAQPPPRITTAALPAPMATALL